MLAEIICYIINTCNDIRKDGVSLFMSKIRDYIMSFTTTEEKLKALAEVNCRASLFEGMFSLEEINEIKTIFTELMVPKKKDQAGNLQIDFEESKKNIALHKSIVQEYRNKQIDEVKAWRNPEITGMDADRNHQSLYYSLRSKGKALAGSFGNLFSTTFAGEEWNAFKGMFGNEPDSFSSFVEDTENAITLGLPEEDRTIQNELMQLGNVYADITEHFSRNGLEYKRSSKLSFAMNENMTFPWATEGEKREQSVYHLTLQGSVQYEEAEKYGAVKEKLADIYADMKNNMSSIFGDSQEYKDMLEAMRAASESDLEGEALADTLKTVRETAGKYISTHISSRSTTKGEKRLNAALGALYAVDSDTAMVVLDKVKEIRKKEEKKPQEFSLSSIKEKYGLGDWEYNEVNDYSFSRERNVTLLNIPKAEDIEKYGKDTRPLGYCFLEDDKYRNINVALKTQFRETLTASDDVRSKDIATLYGFLNGDYSKFGALPKMFQDYAITDIAKKMKASFDKETAVISNPEFRKFLDDNTLNPTLQTAMDLMKAEAIENNEDAKFDEASLSAAMSYMNTVVLDNTLAPVETSFFKTEDVLNSTEYKTNRDKQTILATELLLAHMSDFAINPDTTKQEWGNNNKYSMGEIFGHGGRTMFVLPKGNNGSTLSNLVTGKNNSKVTYGRSAATHAVEMSSKMVDNHKEYVIKEKKSSGSLIKNYGMDLPIGGLGKKFGNENSEWVINNKGLDGHMYMKIFDASKDKPGVILAGIEGEAPQKKGRSGKKHDTSAKKAPISPFGATKHTVGNVLDGRRINLTSFDQGQLIDFVSKLQNSYKGLMDKACNNKLPENERNAAKEKINNINMFLSGTKMDKETLGSILLSEEFNFENNEIAKNFTKDKAPADLTKTAEIINDRINNIISSEADRKITNPRIAFFADTFEDYKKFVKGDKDATEIKEMIADVYSAEFHKKPAKMKEDLTNLKVACENFLKKPLKKPNDETEKSFRKVISNLTQVSQKEILRSDILIEKAAKTEASKKEHEDLPEFKNNVKSKEVGNGGKAMNKKEISTENTEEKNFVKSV